MKKIAVKIAVPAFVLGMTSLVYAGGFQLFEESVYDMGTAFSGTAARADDAATQFYNPAGMTRLEHPAIAFSATAIDLDIDEHATSATNTAVAGGGSGLIPQQTNVSAVTGNPNQKPGGIEGIPAFQFVYPYKKVAFGFGMSVPYGLKTQYDGGSLTRFMATDSRLTVIDFGPSFALQLTPKLSLGVGLDIDNVTTTLNQQTFIFVPATQLSPQATYEGKFVNKGEDWGYGWNAGALYQFTPSTRAGLSYRSKLDFDVDGPASLTLPSNPFPFLQSPTGRADSSFTLPATANLSLYHDFNEKWTALAGLIWTNWNEIQNITIRYSGTISNVIQQANLNLAFRNTWRPSIGMAYHANKKTTLRAGVAYDESPVRNDQTRTFRLPDNNRYWVGLGASYAATKNLSFDVGYAHLFVPNTSINGSQNFSGNIQTVTSVPYSVTNAAIASFDSQVNEFGIQINYRFS